MKVCVIGDIHGTNKFLECYEKILKEDNDCEKIIVLGDHFDPYEGISVDKCIERYNKFIDICKNDNRVISILGNHDLATYVIDGDITNRTSRRNSDIQKIRDAVNPNLKDSYLVYKISNYLFSHAGVSKDWLEDISKYEDECYYEKIMNNQKGWTKLELDDIVPYYFYDFSGYGNNIHQGCTWIRPEALIRSAVEDYNQVIGHTQVHKIAKIKMENEMDLWFTDNSREPEYLTLEI